MHRKRPRQSGRMVDEIQPQWSVRIRTVAIPRLSSRCVSRPRAPQPSPSDKQRGFPSARQDTRRPSAPCLALPPNSVRVRPCATDWLLHLPPVVACRRGEHKRAHAGQRPLPAMDTSSDNVSSRRAEIYTYEAPWLIYGLNWTVRQDKKFRLAVGSFVEDIRNKVGMDAGGVRRMCR